MQKEHIHAMARTARFDHICHEAFKLNDQKYHSDVIHLMDNPPNYTNRKL